ncbi:MAG TPA: hypothetical protein ENK06_08980 [Gammaproteobacteria bacterium]|nr:hypothetical protein [Gammaproteobacteria bacterium]
MGRIVDAFFLQGARPAFVLVCLLGLAGCPAKDWIKREDTYLSVEQYKLMTDVIRVNDSLYRVKKGEEINQNKITQLFIDFQAYKNSPKSKQKKQRNLLKLRYQSDKTVFNTLSYVLVLLERKSNESKARRILSGLAYESMTNDEKNLFNLAHILQDLLKRNRLTQRKNARLNKKLATLKTNHELLKEEVRYLNKQVNALKSIEENIHSREVGLELESR